MVKTFCSAPCHITKREDIVWWKAWIIRVVAVLIAMVVCGVITVALTKLNPIKMYITMFEGAVGTRLDGVRSREVPVPTPRHGSGSNRRSRWVDLPPRLARRARRYVHHEGTAQLPRGDRFAGVRS